MNKNFLLISNFLIISFLSVLSLKSMLKRSPAVHDEVRSAVVALLSITENVGEIDLEVVGQCIEKYMPHDDVMRKVYLSCLARLAFNSLVEAEYVQDTNDYDYDEQKREAAITGAELQIKKVLEMLRDSVLYINLGQLLQTMNLVLNEPVDFRWTEFGKRPPLLEGVTRKNDVASDSVMRQGRSRYRASRKNCTDFTVAIVAVVYFYALYQLGWLPKIRLF